MYYVHDMCVGKWAIKIDDRQIQLIRVTDDGKTHAIVTLIPNNDPTFYH